MKSAKPTILQKQIVEIISSVKHPSTIAKFSNTTGRCINYWVSGERLPRDIVTIEDVLKAMGYELIIKQTGEPDK